MKTRAVMGRGIIIALMFLMPGLGVYHAPPGTDECTIGVASGNVTVDGRPLLWKVRDLNDDRRQRLLYIDGSPYNYIGVQSEGGGIFMGLNGAGVATGNSLVKLTPGDTSNLLFHRQILENHASIDQITNYIQSEVTTGTLNASGAFAFIDADGNAIIVEVNRSAWFLEYDSMDPDRKAQELGGFVVRANEFHQRLDGIDNTNIGGRYRSARYNVSGLVGIDELGVKTIIQGNDDANDFELARYGPGRSLSTISRSTTRSVIAVNGVAQDEDPALATMWVVLGQPNYSIAVPTWVKVSDIPQSLSSGDMYDRARSLYNKGNEAATQASTLPVEAHLFDVVNNTLLPHWRAEGVPSIAEMTRIEHRMANDAYSLLDCLDNRQRDNKAPEVTFNMFPNELTVNFTLSVNDSDGNIDTIRWNFGDNQTSTNEAPLHTYAGPGRYLVSLTVTDDDGVSITDWGYVTVLTADNTPATVSSVSPQNGTFTTRANSVPPNNDKQRTSSEPTPEVSPQPSLKPVPPATPPQGFNWWPVVGTIASGMIAGLIVYIIIRIRRQAGVYRN